MKRRKSPSKRPRKTSRMPRIAPGFRKEHTIWTNRSKDLAGSRPRCVLRTGCSLLRRGLYADLPRLRGCLLPCGALRSGIMSSWKMLSAIPPLLPLGFPQAAPVTAGSSGSARMAAPSISLEQRRLNKTLYTGWLCNPKQSAGRAEHRRTEPDFPDRRDL